MRNIPFAAISSALQPILTIIIMITMTLSIKALVTSLPTIFLQCLICTAGSWTIPRTILHQTGKPIHASRSILAGTLTCLARTLRSATPILLAFFLAAVDTRSPITVIYATNEGALAVAICVTGTLILLAGAISLAAQMLFVGRAKRLKRGGASAIAWFFLNCLVSARFVWDQSTLEFATSPLPCHFPILAKFLTTLLYPCCPGWNMNANLILHPIGPWSSWLLLQT